VDNQKENKQKNKVLQNLQELFWIFSISSKCFFVEDIFFTKENQATKTIN